jgi:hypothetical protein
MNLLAPQAYCLLIVFDLYLAAGSFARLYRRVKNSRISSISPESDAIEAVSSAINLACIWYPKEVLCLQRSAACVCLLRRYGIPAQMIIGAQQMPFKAHAWVEVSGKVVNDKSYTPEMYAELDRC